ncbi:CinA family nicotinamide mononucleotide deamidase-related protein [Photobacterium damselae]
MTKIAMISTGEEVLYGDIVDTNASWLSHHLCQLGFTMAYRSTVGDNLESICEEIKRISKLVDVVIVNGGLGPTTDDLSAQAAAKALGVQLELNEAWVEQMHLKFQQMQRDMPKSNLKQAMLPLGAELIDNPVGTACGFCIELNNARVYFTPGVPREFKHMVETQIVPKLQRFYSSAEAKQVERIYTFGLTESGISDVLDYWNLPEGCELGYRSALPFIEIKLFHLNNKTEQITAFKDAIIDKFQANVVSVDQSLLDALSEQLTKKKQTLNVSEVGIMGTLAYQFSQHEGIANLLINSRCSYHLVAPVELSVLAQQLQKEVSEQLEDIGLYIYANNDKSYTLALITHQYQKLIRVKPYRQYNIKNQSILIATLVQIMLLNYLLGNGDIDEYLNFEYLGVFETEID